MLSEVQVKWDKEYIGTSEGIRFYLKEGALDSYGTLKNHISHYYHLELKSPERTVEVALTEQNLKRTRDEFGVNIFYKIMEKVGYKGFNPETLIKANTEFASK